jgi:type I restriction enzyme S subunit
MRLNKIPKGWEVVSLGDNRYFEILPSGVKEFKGKKLYLSTKCIERNRIVNVESEITFSNRPSRANMQPVVNSVWFAKMKNTIKVYAFTEENSEEAEKYILSTGFCGIKCKEKITTKYLEQFFMSDFFNKLKDSLVTGSTQQDIKNKIVAKIPIILPSLKEREEIVNVLSTIDKAIQKVDEIIAKTERLKKGLMQKLLTKGIGHKEFKDTEIGRIPKEWEVVRLKEVVIDVKSGFASGRRDENGILQLRMDNIEPEGWINIEKGVKVPIPKDVEEYILKNGDILFNNTNSVDLIGKTAIFRGEFSRCVYSNHLTRIRVNPNKVVPEWVLYLLIRKWELGVFKAICHRHVHQAGINNEDLLRLKIPLPPLQEQSEIVSILLVCDKKLRLERKRREKLERIKKGLMNDLLTGKKRVRVRI